ncbi:hypothetical protein O6H91_11G027600 [Diphasiastrum complanatum]|uniref:Uncharacterized protein n=1 Tax=Diphasiastrum complanatum TaxID=34168 RepID=A0ACC2C795_DIPCM|nr:hypothetical protein O6H91_11G027600 [Diphasiastrum complanatum]
MTEGGIIHRFIEANGIRMHIAEQGSGTLVLLLHGFPETWYSWRHQIPVLAAAGFHAVAPDLRGHGDTDSPSDVQAYTAFHSVGDMIGLLDALGQEKAFVVGHDYGALLAWYLSILRPDRVKAVAALCVPAIIRKREGSLVEKLDQFYGKGFYISRFQEPGRAEAEFARLDVKTVMKKFFVFFSQNNLAAKEDQDLLDVVEEPETLPWISEDELNQYVVKFRKSGFTGAVNYYRMMQWNWEHMSPWTDTGTLVPALYIVGDQDSSHGIPGIKEFIDGGDFVKFVPNLKGIVVIPGGHFIQQECPHEVNKHLTNFLAEHL